MKKSSLFKLWDIVYPILLYYVVTNLVPGLAYVLFGMTEEQYQKYYTLLMLVAALFALPVLRNFWRRDKLLNKVFHQRLSYARQDMDKKRRVLSGVLSFCGGALAGLVLNQLIGAVGLADYSSSYQEVTELFFAPGIVLEILSVGICVPIVEELLYRGIVYGRLSDWVGNPAAMVISSLIFGALHFNLVQFVYASIMALLLVFFLEKSHSLWGAVLGHVGANLLTILRAETGILRWMDQSKALTWGTTILAAALCALMVWALAKVGEEKAKIP